MTRILIVDDSHDNIAICATILQKEPYEILSARNGPEAIDVAERDRPDVILLDVQMPGMDGFEVCKRLKASPATAGIPILFISAHNRDAESIANALSLGGGDYILKPFNSAELRARVAVLVRLKQALDALVQRNEELESANHALSEANSHMAKAHEALTLLALTDPLTGVYNRRYFDRRLLETFSLAERHQVPLHVLALDLDHFKSINDRYGHPAGDQMLIYFAEVLKRCVRRHDVVARVGGEEFDVLMFNISKDKAVRAAERIRAQMEKGSLVLDGKTVRVTTSIGLATLDPEVVTNPDPEALIRAADTALYAAKNQGRNRVIVAPAG
jgi:diguanylate cyclase (GGDEF)-like protein